MKTRFLYHDLIKYLNHKNALIITGMRQVGKTTLMKQIFDTVDAPKLWFDFDNPLDMLTFEDINYDAIYQKLKNDASSGTNKVYIFIDEIQNYPEITKIIKYHIDKYKVKYIVTGSSNYYLKNLFPESLSGRKFLFILQPLNFREYLYFKDQIKEPDSNYNLDYFEGKNNLISHKKFESYYTDFLEYGGFPEIVVTGDKETRRLILKNIFASFFEKDLKILSDMKDIRELRDLILILTPRTGSILDITKLSSELGVNRVKIYNYLELLQGIFFLMLIPKYSKSIDRSVAGGRKVYFSDTGLLNTIGKINDGQLFENAVANQLKHYGDLSYFNKRNTAEIDFIINKSTAIEVKMRGSSRDLVKLEKYAKSIGIDKYYLVSKKFTDLQRSISPVLI